MKNESSANPAKGDVGDRPEVFKHVAGTRSPAPGRRRFRSYALLGVLLATLSHTVLGASAAPLSPEDELLKSQLAFEKSSGLKSIVELRTMWALWESADPRRVEEALRVAAESDKHGQPVKVYAKLLSAYARLRRGDFASAKSTIKDLGFVTDFLVLGPFDNEGKSGFERKDQPDLEPAQALVGGRAYTGKERPVRYRRTTDVSPFGWVDLGSMLRPAQHVCAYATTFVKGFDKAKDITVWVGASGAFRLDVNGQEVLTEKSYRGYDADRLGRTIRLLPGENRFTLKLCGAERAPVFSLRLADAQGRPDKTLVARAEFEASAQAEKTVNEVLAKKPALPKHPAALTAPLERALAVINDKAASAERLEEAARYLVETAGDDPALHQARDLTDRAVEKSPSVASLILAARLAEDRNVSRRNLEKAEEIAKKTRLDATTPDGLELLLAKAWLLRTGPSPSEAFPVYDQVLALDPANITALRGRVELYNAAGLRRTALGTLEAAWAENPHSVLLASMVASQRKSLGLTALAFEAEERYSALRFDDSSLLSDRMELALARRNRAATAHFLDRLIGTDPDGVWGFHTASRIHRALGDDARARFDLESARAMVPEDITVLRALADLKGRAGDRDAQLALLAEVLKIRPQEVDVRKYVEHIKPKEAPADERYALPSEEFLKKRHAPALGHARRTLRDLTVSTVYENGLSSQFRQVVFQPLTDSSAAASRQYAFHYEASQQVVELKGARVYRADGTVDEAIESGEGAANDPSVSMYTSGRTFYIQFPRLEPGDVVEARYRIDDVTPRNEFADYFGEVVHLQNDEPTSNAEYVLVTPKTRKVFVDAQVPGVVETVSETKDAKIYRFSLNEVPALAPEPAMPPWSEVLGFIHVSTYATWEALGAWYWGLVKEQFDLDPETRKLAREITKDAKTDREKVEKVYGWVVKNTRYVALEFGIYGYKPRRCVQTVARGWGDCKDKATVIVTLLRELGIDARLVILRTGMRGDFRSKLPSLAPFDHAIAYVPSLDLYLDGTAEYTGSTELPSMDQGAVGIVIEEGKARPVRLPVSPPEANLIERTLTVQLDKEGAAKKFGLTYGVRGYAAAGFRARYEASGTQRERLAQDLGSEFPGLDIDKGGIKTGDLSELEKPVSISVEGKTPEFARREGTRLSVPVTLSSRLTPEYASLSKRQQDVVISGQPSRKETVVVTVPNGFRTESTPPNLNVKSRFGSYSIDVKQEGQIVTVTSTLALNVTRVHPADYAEFRKFCVEADQALNHRLRLAQ